MINKTKNKKGSREFGPAAQKAILLLGAGLFLGLSESPSRYFRIIRGVTKEWKNIDRNNLNRTIKNLYRAKMVDVIENKDGTVTLTLSEDGKEKALKYNIDQMKLPQNTTWDKKWRIYTFDIPEWKKKARDAFRFHISKLGMYKFQKSAWIYPHPCEKELEFLIEFYEVKPYVRYILAEKIDNEIHLKKVFHLV